MTETATQIPLSTVIPIFAAISDRNWVKFKELELEFANNHGVETWASVFNFRVLPALDKETKTWVLVQKCSKGYTVKQVA
ncbi:MAG: hypothetical protein KME60_09620 [Cyanomargarita calcarea GSE-NOS-MK-12-04C]|jgi:hypothetical protein|uniref:Uncharacterized protein n=1 Tax=Cyanomargarita calcarea GSE-NOS-MK-12-04C TaxID=2839659 RepID=A0A951USU9_9CYAN|nr:hypothetical protein [Cyanomargarita calcarea GSE-NOS-MK-12-04C]